MELVVGNGRRNMELAIFDAVVANVVVVRGRVVVIGCGIVVVIVDNGTRSLALGIRLGVVSGWMEVAIVDVVVDVANGSGGWRSGGSDGTWDSIGGCGQRHGIVGIGNTVVCRYGL